MNFSDYQRQARETAIYPSKGSNFIYPTLGLCGESGEVAEKIKKILRDKGGKVSMDDRVELRKELGDCLWYVSNLASELGITMDEVAEANIAKLQSRLQRGMLHGEGDNR